MPAPRLPWVKLWIESMEHEKIEALSDPVYRTWTRCLLRAVHQRTKWRFASAKHAASVVGRPLAHITHLVEVGLLIQRENGLWVSGWRKWQDRVNPSIPAGVRRRVIARDGLVCALCGQPVPPEEVNLDHIVPVSHGGPTTEANLRVTHGICNRRRGNRV